MRKYKSELVAGPLHLFYPKVLYPLALKPSNLKLNQNNRNVVTV